MSLRHPACSSKTPEIGDKISLTFEEGDEVKVTAGLFEGYTGTVQAISEDKLLVTVLVKRGRRDMPVELEISMIKAAD